MQHEESAIQAGIVMTLSAMGVFLFSVPNEGAGKTTIQRAARLKGMGLRAGISDLILMGPDGRAHFLEIKTKNGKLSESQERFQTLCGARGWPYAVARSVEDAVAIARGWGLLQNASKRTRKAAIASKVVETGNQSLEPL